MLAHDFDASPKLFHINITSTVILFGIAFSMMITILTTSIVILVFLDSPEKF